MEPTSTSGVLVCITDQLSCERLIRAGRAIADEKGRSLSVVTVLPQGEVSAHTASVMQDLYDMVRTLDAEMTFYFHQDAALTVAVHARSIGAAQVITGSPGVDSNRFIETVKELLPEVPLTIVDADGRMFTFPALNVVRQSAKA